MTLYTLSFHCPSISTGGWIQDPCQTPKSMEAQVPYIKQHRTMPTTCLPRTPDHGEKILLDAKPMDMEGQPYS